MKVTIKSENKSNEIKYPCLMIANDGEIVLFYSDGVGVVIKATENKIGQHSNYWVMDMFTLFTGTVELSND